MDKKCRTCGESFPNDREHFYYKAKRGLSSVCLVCHRARRERQKQREKVRHEQALQRVEAAGLDVYAALARQGGSNIPHSAELVEKITEYFGGVSGLAAILVKQYYDSKAGSSTRNKLLETIVRLIQGNVDQGGARKPIELWTEEELEAELNKRFEMAVLAQKRIINAAPQAITAEDSDDTLADAARTESDSGDSQRVEEPGIGGSEHLPPEPAAGTDSSVQSERDSGDRGQS